jgi:hypothetical protein
MKKMEKNKLRNCDFCGKGMTGDYVFIIEFKGYKKAENGKEKIKKLSLSYVAPRGEIEICEWCLMEIYDDLSKIKLLREIKKYGKN